MSKRRIARAGALTALLILVYAFVVLPLNHTSNGSEFLISTKFMQNPTGGVTVNHKLYGLFSPAKQSEKSARIGGFPIAMALFTDGVIVDDIAPVETAFGRATPASQLKKGDFITGLNGLKISCNSDLENVVANPPAETAMRIKVLRGGEEKTFEIKPALEEFSNKYRLGLIVRDYILGVGMVSYVNEDGTFASLGHPISDGVAGKVPIRAGIAYDCQQVGLAKGEKGVPGELKVRMDSARTPIGNIYKSTSSGVYGRFHTSPNSTKYPVASRRLVKTGDASIFVQLNGVADFYKIEIIRAISQSEYSDKGLIIRITDPRLLDLTGGIIQGMSGSPIIQNNRLVGAVTHVFINDPTKGYGIYMDWMHE